jgi:hypothetical protein
LYQEYLRMQNKLKEVGIEDDVENFENEDEDGKQI